jgi:hypothetical protein
VVLGLAAQQRWPWDPSQATAPLMAALQGLCQRLLRELPKGDELEAAWQREMLGVNLLGDSND